MQKEKKYLLIIILTSFVIRLFFAANLQLGNDEVYYWLYAKYPALSYFDHPPILGWLLSIFTFNLNLDSELTLRSMSLVFGAINTFFVYKTAEILKDKKAGLIAAALYNSSIYLFVISGIFILPDSPMLLFWTLSLYFSVKLLFTNSSFNKNIIIIGILIGLAALAKLHAILIWFGFLLYFVRYKKEYFKKPSLYLSGFISLLILLPFFIWNFQNDFATIRFQGNRMSFFESGINFNYFLSEVLGEILYNNPINVAIIIFSVIIALKSKFENKQKIRFLLFSSIPIIAIFLFVSLFKRTLPHWSAPAYLPLIILTSLVLSDKSKKIIPLSIKISFIFIFTLLIIAFAEIKYGIIPQKQTTDIKLGENDFTLDMYGWEQINNEFEKIKKTDAEFSDKAIIVAHKWFNAAHLDYYVASKNNIKLAAIGSINDIHEYKRINEINNIPRKGQNAYFFNLSRNLIDIEIFASEFKEIELYKKFYVYKNNKPVETVFVYKLYDYQSQK